MTIKLESLSRWNHLAPANSLILETRERGVRRIRISVNSPGLARFFVVLDGKERFLATVDRCDTIEFYAEGVVEVVTTDENVFVHTAEHEPTHIRVTDPVIFTRIANRKARNPDLEHMMHLMHVNLEKRLARAEADADLRVKAAISAANQAVHEAPAPAKPKAKKPAKETVPPAPPVEDEELEVEEEEVTE